jgi:hypothetical protein
LGQSTNVSYPTPLRTGEIGGEIKARDIGDARLTTYYYTFLAEQGDLFINVVSRNFNGDIDVFLADGLKPLTKVVLYADVTETETGRVLYFRKPERLILRVEGRSPNDDPASFRIKFAGSFMASRDPSPEEPELPETSAANDTGIKVNSVGTIIAVVPKVRPTPKPPAVRAEEPATTGDVAKEVETERPSDVTARAKPEVVVTDNTPEPSASPEPTDKVTAARAPARRTAARRSPVRTRRATRAPSRAKAEPPTSVPAEKPIDRLASIILVIEFKSGSRIERPMSEILRMTVDRGVLTVISKDGTIGRYSILDVARTTIQ